MLNASCRSVAAGCLALAAGCAGERGPAVLTADVPLHLEAKLEGATVESSEVPRDLPAAREWTFAEPQAEWKPMVPVDERMEPVAARVVDGALRLTLGSGNRTTFDRLLGRIYVALGESNRQEWECVEVRARTSDQMSRIGLEFNYTEEDPLNVFPTAPTRTGRGVSATRHRVGSRATAPERLWSLSHLPRSGRP
jgi:hypothetical protein